MKDFPDIYNMHSAYILFLDYNNLQEFEWRRVNMATFDANKLKEYHDWYNQELAFSNLSNNVVKIGCPFKDYTLDNFIIYAIYD